MMNSPVKILKWLLLFGALYFLLVSAAHMIGIKVPGLFVYFNVPSYKYQDRIISFLAFGWVMFLLSGFASVKKNVVEPIKYILFAGAAGIIGLCIINIFTDFNQLSKNVNIYQYWFETIFLFVYFTLLVIFYYKSKRRFSS